MLSKGTNMNYKDLGTTGIKVSSLCMGTMTFGNEADEKTSESLFNRCREVGINFFDCADVYAGGKSEEILGKLIHGIRDEVVITTKLYGKVGEDVNASGASRYHIRQAIDSSLNRLQTDHVDVYFVHHFPKEIPLEIVLRNLDDLVRQGKILHIGASNFAAWQFEKALGISLRNGLNRVDVIQPMYNLVKRQAEVEILPMALENNLGVVTYSPLGGGLLTGKYLDDEKKEGRIATNPMYQARYGEKDNFETAARFVEFARVNGYDPSALAVAWVASHPAVTAPIIGARNLEQLEGSLKSLEIEMTPDLRQSISALSPEPPLATDREDERGKIE
jgi:aryl-alcohol dehydrogenase-like predicted oxidoreductase